LSAPAQNAIAGLAAAVEKQEIKPFDVRPARRQSDLEDEQRNKVITRLSEENPATVAEIIQLWLNEDSNNHG
jgi:flagellar biosynthesis/type III secretory pathway M-ring protein FliF/YscJ